MAKASQNSIHNLSYNFFTHFVSPSSLSKNHSDKNIGTYQNEVISTFLNPKASYLKPTRKIQSNNANVISPFRIFQLYIKNNHTFKKNLKVI